jgi:putative cell wall-binding protein
MQLDMSSLTNGMASFPWVKFSTPGNHAITATYQGSNTYSGGTSDSIAIVVSGATVSGKVTSAATGNPIAGAGVWAIHTSGDGFNTTMTDAQGNYSFVLGAGPWVIWSGSGPGGSELKSERNATVVTGQNLTGQDLALVLPTPMPTATSFNTGQGTTASGSPTLFGSDLITFATTQCPNGTVTLGIVSDVGGAIQPLTLAETPPGSGHYTVTFDGAVVLQGHHGDTVFTITVTCPGAGPVEIKFDGYIDPSGTVVDQTGAPINGATVVLEAAPAFGGPYSAVPNGSIVMSPSNRLNPWPTKADGKYAWDVLPGFYRVVASAPGCTTVTSEHFAIPPEVTDLTLTLNCASASKVRRFAGLDRIGTAVLVSQDSFAGDLGQAVVLARADDFADALASGPLATARRGPLLLTATSGLDSRVRSEIDRVLPAGGAVVIAGGAGAVSEAVADALRADGFNVTRISGVNRYATAAAIADAVVAAMGAPAQAALLATGIDFPDGLVAGPAAAHLKGVVLLTSGKAMPGPTAAWLAAHPGITTFAIGGPAAGAAPTATAIVGDDRYTTATMVATRFFTNPTLVGVVSGVAFPDALVGAARLGANDAPLVLTAPPALSAATQSYLSGLNPRPARFEVYGGTSAVAAAIDDTLNGLAA